MFSRFLKPRWKHANPEIRREAVARINDPVILLEIANNDRDTGVRKAAIERIPDLATLTSVNIAPEIQQALNERFAALLPTALDDERLLAPAENYIRARGGPALLESLIRHPNVRLRQWLLPRIDDTTLLERMAAGDASAEIRQLAAERLETPEAIRRALKALGRRDKRVTRLLKQRLEQIEADAATKQEIEALIDAITQLGNAEQWQRDSTELMRLRNRWQQLADKADDAQRQRFDDASKQAEAAIDEHRRQAEALQPVIDAKASQCELMEDFVTHLRQRHRISPTEASDLQTTLDTLLADWNELAVLPEHLEVPLANRFHRQLTEARRLVATLLENSRSGRDLERIIEQAEKLLRKKTITEKAVERLRQQWAEQKLPKDPALADEYRQHFDRLSSQLQLRLDRQQAARDKGLAEIDQLLARIESNLDDDRLGDSIELEKRIRQILDGLADVPRKRLDAISQRLRDFSPRIRELDGWRHWGTDRVREELIEEAEKLVDTPQTPQERAKAVAELRQRWKGLSAIDHALNRRLWKRFDKACNAAWELCAEHRRQEAEQRKKNLAERETICAELEALHQQATADTPAWREIDRRFQQLRNRWRDAGPVDRNDWRKINRRYRKALDTMNEALRDERERNRAERMALIERLEALADSDDLPAAMAAVRDAQKAWQLTVSSKRSVEQAMWKRFKAAGDAIFARERARIGQQAETTNQLLRQKADICEALERLAEQPEEIDRQLPELQQRWDDTEMPRGRDAAALEQRYREALKGIDFARERLALEKRLVDVEAACTAITVSDDADTPEQLLELEILLDLPSPPELAEARMARKVAMLSERLNERGNEDTLEQAIEQLLAFCAPQTGNAVTPADQQRLFTIREAIAGELTSRIAELRQS